MASPRYTIAIMDEEAKERNVFMNFFEDDFNVVEISFVASTNELINRIKSDGIDAIAIDYKLKEHGAKFRENGDYFFKELMSRLQEFPAFVLTQDAKAARTESKLIKPRFIVDKSILHSSNKIETKAFINQVKSEVKIYKAQIKEKLTRLKELQKLKNTTMFNADLENEYLTLNNEIAQSFTGYSTIPLKFFTQETNQKLDDIISKTDALIKKVSKKK